LSLISRLFVYAAATVAGLVVGLFLNGSYVESELLINGISTHGLTQEQVIAAMQKNPSQVSYQEALVVSGERWLVTSGTWLMWATNIVPALLLCLLAFGGIRYLERKRNATESNAA
jgi:hypothetical protein